MIKSKTIVSNYKYEILDTLMFRLSETHAQSDLNKIKNELNRLFVGYKCLGVLYTENTDKMFFGMRVYPQITEQDVIRVLNDDEPIIFANYYVEFDSKLFDPMVALEGNELTAILLHEIGHIVCDTATIDEVRKAVDIYFANGGDSIATNKFTYGYKKLLAYAMKDSVMKIGSIFSKLGDDEIYADSFVVSCGYGPALESGMRKITRSQTLKDKSADNRLLTLAWVLRLQAEFNVRRIPALHTLNRAKYMTGSELEKQELEYAYKALSTVDSAVSEGFKDFVSKRMHNFKVKGIRAVKDEIFELNLRLRAAESEDDLMFIIRAANNNINILNDYLNDPDVSDYDRKDTAEVLQQLYDIRQRASTDKKIRDKYSSYIQVYYPD